MPTPKVKKKIRIRDIRGKLRKLDDEKVMTVEEFISHVRIPARKFETVADEIVALHVRCLEQKARSLGYGIRIGELLSKQKENLRKTQGHGFWVKWIENNLVFKRQTVSKYIRVYENREKFLNGTLGFHMTFTEAAKQLQPPKKKEITPPVEPKEKQYEVQITAENRLFAYKIIVASRIPFKEIGRKRFVGLRRKIVIDLNAAFLPYLK